MKVSIFYQLIIALTLVSQFSFAEDAMTELMKKYESQMPEAKDTVGSKPKKSNRVAEKTKEIKPVKEGKANPHTLQVGSYDNKEDAKAKLQQLTAAGFDGRLVEASISGKNWYRIQVGKFDSRKSAEAYLHNLDSKSLLKKAFVTRLQESPKIEKPSMPVEPEKNATQKPEPLSVAKEEKSEAKNEQEEEHEQGVFGSWFGLKDKVSKSGIEIQARYKVDSVSNVGGGIERKSVFLGNFDLTFDFDLNKLLGWQGLSITLYGLGDHGDHPREFVGDRLGSSNIEAPSTFKLYEAYVKHAIDDRFSYLIGLRDLNADFNQIDAAAGFLNSAFGVTPTLAQTGVNGPSIFPTTALAFTFKYQSPSSFYLESGVFNAKAGDPEKPYGTTITTQVDDGYLYIWEAGVLQNHPKSHTKFAVGAWTYTLPKAALDTTKPDTRNSGYYIIADTSLSSETSFFVKYGEASQDVNEFKSSIETGLAMKQPFVSRPSDLLSVGFAQAKATPDNQTLNSLTADESVYEVSYRYQIVPGFSVTPDYQFVQNPSLNPEVKSASVLSFRFEVLL